MVSRALIVDDDRIMLDILEIVLVKNNFNVTRAESGEEAIEALDHDDFGLVITDLKMGWINGLEVTRKVRQLTETTTIIMITGCCDPQSEAEAYACGVDDFLPKPFSVADLLERLQRMAYFPDRGRQLQERGEVSG